jgi:hypothetical protein
LEVAVMSGLLAVVIAIATAGSMAGADAGGWEE